MRVLDLAQDFDVVTFTNSPHRRDEITEAVYRKQRRALERRDVERACEVRAMMLHVMKPCTQTLLRNIQSICQIVFQVTHLRGVREPIRDLTKQSSASLFFSIAATAKTLRRALRRKENLLMQVSRRVARDADVFDLRERTARGLKTILDGLCRKPCAMFFAIEPLFLHGCDQSPVADDGRGSIAVISIDSQNVHLLKIL